MTGYNEIGFLKAEKYRIPILRILGKTKCISSEITEKMGIDFPHVSRTLSELEKYGLIICDTPNRKKGRIYAITEKGITALDELGENIDDEKE